MKKSMLVGGVTLLFAFLLSGCATVFTGTKDRLYFDSNPSGAKVIIDGVHICTTPCNETVSRSLSNKDAEFVLEGYKTKVVSLDKKFNVISLVNIIAPIGFLVDLATGSIYEYDRKQYNIEMERPENTKVAGVQEIRIDTVNKEVTITKLAKN